MDLLSFAENKTMTLLPQGRKRLLLVCNILQNYYSFVSMPRKTLDITVEASHGLLLYFNRNSVIVVAS